MKNSTAPNRIFPSLPAAVLVLGTLIAGTLTLSAQAPKIPVQDTPPEPVAAASEGDSDTFAPKEYSIDRYQKIRGKSPFEFELAKPPVAETIDPFADLVLAGYAGSGRTLTAYLLNTKTQERITVYGEGSGRENKSGFKILGINRGTSLATTTASVEKSGNTKELAFDAKALYSMTGGAGGGAPAGGPRPGIPGQPGVPGQPIVRPGGIPGRPATAGAAAPYQAPQAFIPGQNGRGNPGGTVAGVPGATGLAVNQLGNGVQQLGTPNQAGATNAQQQLNTMLSNAGGQPAQQANVPASTVFQGTGTNTPAATPGGNNPQPRRRVVLPNTAP